MAQGGGLIRLKGMRLFAVIWSVQFFSLLGTYMSQFALSIWAWQLTGEATALALVALFNFAPTVIMLPVAGVLVDRWNRKLVMMISDIASITATIIIFILLSTGKLEIWHLYAIGAFTGIFQSFQWPAYSASTSLIVEKKDYSRASGMLGLADSIPNIFAPAAAGILITVIGVAGILTIDIITFLLAISILLIVVVPQPTRSVEKRAMLGDTIFGFKYISERRGLLGLQLNIFASNIVTGLAFTVLTPMLMLRTFNDTFVTGSVQSALGVGSVVGGLVLTVWGGPKRKVDGVLLGMVVSGLLGMTIFGIAQTPTMLMVGAFLTMLFIPLCNSSNQAIWQSKVPQEIQGRVFGTRALIATVSAPLTMAIAGPLVDRVMTPSMKPGGIFYGIFGWLVGTGPGAGIGLLFFFLGIIGAIVSLSGYAFRAIREVENDIPDHNV